MKCNTLYWRHSYHLEAQKRQPCRERDMQGQHTHCWVSTAACPLLRVHGSSQHRNLTSREQGRWLSAKAHEWLWDAQVWGKGERPSVISPEVSINCAINIKIYFLLFFILCYLEANILGSKETWLPICVLGWELKPVECDNILVNILVNEILDVKVNLLNASSPVSQIIKSLLMANKLIY